MCDDTREISIRTGTTPEPVRMPTAGVIELIALRPCNAAGLCKLHLSVIHSRFSGRSPLSGSPVLPGCAYSMEINLVSIRWILPVQMGKGPYGW